MQHRFATDKHDNSIVGLFGFVCCVDVCDSIVRAAQQFDEAIAINTFIRICDGFRKDAKYYATL